MFHPSSLESFKQIEKIIYKIKEKFYTQIQNYYTKLAFRIE